MRTTLNNVTIGNITMRNGHIVMFLCADDSGDVTHEIHLSADGENTFRNMLTTECVLRKNHMSQFVD